MKKLKNTNTASFKPKQVRKFQERVEMKIIAPIGSNPTHSKEFCKNSKKI